MDDEVYLGPLNSAPHYIMDAAQPGNVWTVGKVPDFPDEIRRYKF